MAGVCTIWPAGSTEPPSLKRLRNGRGGKSPWGGTRLSVARTDLLRLAVSKLPGSQGSLPKCGQGTGTPVKRKETQMPSNANTRVFSIPVSPCLPERHVSVYSMRACASCFSRCFKHIFSLSDSFGLGRVLTTTSYRNCASAQLPER